MYFLCTSHLYKGKLQLFLFHEKYVINSQVLNFILFQTNISLQKHMNEPYSLCGLANFNPGLLNISILLSAHKEFCPLGELSLFMYVQHSYEHAS